MVRVDSQVEEGQNRPRLQPVARQEAEEMNDPNAPPALQPLPDMRPDSPLSTEWNVYRRERERLLAEGHEGRWVLIKGEEIIGLFDTRMEAREAGLTRLGRTDMLVHQVLRQEPIIRAGNWWRCRP
jgi:hypothetical protein